MKTTSLASFAALYCAFTIAKDEEISVYRGTNCWDLERFANACAGCGASSLLARVSWSDEATGRAIKQIAPHRTRYCKPP